MKKIFLFPILYVLIVYSIVVTLNIPYINYLLMILFLLCCIFNIYIGIRYCNSEHRDNLLKCAIIIKYLLIPFYLFGALLIVISFAFIIIPHLSFMVIGAFVFTIIGWIILIFGNPYLISYAVILYREKKINIAILIIHIVSSFFFCFDVINTMWFSIINNVLRKITIFVISILVILFAIITFRIIFFLI